MAQQGLYEVAFGAVVDDCEAVQICIFEDL